MAQMIQKESVSPSKIEVTFISSLTDTRLRDVIKGHTIEGIAIYPASAYVDMASTAANWTARVSFHSQSNGGKFDDHGKCKVLTDDPAEKKPEWTENAELVKQRIRALMNPDDTSDNEVHHLRSRVLYKLFNSVVKYNPRYQAITEAFVDYDFHDAVAKVRLTPTPDSEKKAFVLNPYHSDSLVHLAGFLLNSDGDDSQDVLHFSSGLDSMMMAAEVKESKTYLGYVRMLINAKGQSVGDIYLVNGQEAVGVVAGLKFQQLRRALLRLTLASQQQGTAHPGSNPSRGLDDRIRNAGATPVCYRAGSTLVDGRRGQELPGDAVVNPMAAESRCYKKWFYSRRQTYDANGRDVLVGDVETHVIDGDHWKHA
ncbi:hypothetical protein F4778DRAFT_779313 [Xylariomycetidae sp. FL2044]|nr:hypothetical protein F4778DRAFT_779313 [Xylariomycetidae sp. FL2044]